MSHESPIPIITVDVSPLVRMAANAHEIFGSYWEDLLTDDRLAASILESPRRHARNLLGTMACYIETAECYDADPEAPITRLSPNGSVFLGSLVEVDLNPIETDPEIPYYPDVASSISLVFIVLDDGELVEGMKLGGAVEKVAVPLLPRFSKIYGGQEAPLMIGKVNSIS